ncbi:MAG: MFS transporter [Anaerolineae bacterium]|nr:MFS transporter [Anaerolineae bacterium]
MRFWNNLIPYGDHNFRRNYALHLGNGALTALGDAMTNNVVMTSFASQLTSSNVVIALLVLMKDGGWFLPQYFVAPWAERLPLKLQIYRGTTAIRMATWAAIVLMTLFIPDRSTLLWAFFAGITFIAMASGVAGLPWQLATAKIIPAEKRGSLFGMRQFLGSILGLAGGAAIALILSGNLGLDFPRNYALIFALSALFMLGGYALFGMVVEPPDPPLKTVTSLGALFGRARAILSGDPRYRAFLLLRSLLFLGNASVPFITVYARRAHGAGDAYFGLVAVVTLVVGLLANLLWGRLSERRGNRFVLGVVGACGAATCASLVGLAVAGLANETAQALLIAPFILSTMATTGIGVVGSPMLMDITPANDRVHYFGLTNTLLGVVMLATAGVGAIADGFGFASLFGVCAASFLGALACVRLLSRSDQIANQKGPASAALSPLQAGSVSDAKEMVDDSEIGV